MEIKDIPRGTSPAAIPVPHFPAPHLAVIWRNWNLVPLARIAAVLETTEERVLADGEAMGLIRDDSNLELFAQRNYQVIIRTNWHLLDYEQLLKLLDWTADRLAFTLREEDFLWVKLGLLKPSCPKVIWRPLTDGERQATARIEKIAGRLQQIIPAEAERPFAFLEKFGQGQPLGLLPEKEHLRLIYSYCAPYGDPFIDEKNDPFPESLLKAYASAGINSVWLPAILYTLVPWLGDLPVSEGWQTRLANLKKMAKRASAYGIRLFLYINEPRALPPAVVEQTGFGGASWRNGELMAFCPYADGMLEALSAGIERLCREVPELGGFFTITMSENLTHCLSRQPLGGDEPEITTPCPHCAEHSAEENVALVLNAIRDGIRRAGSDARVNSWTWGWQILDEDKILARLPKDIFIQCVSETNVPTDCRGYKSAVLDYSISKPGPGPDAVRIWRKAQAHGLSAVAKVQINVTWEMSGVPFIPVPYLVQQHLDNLREVGVKDFMLSWTLGGYPGGNLPLLSLRVEELARRQFGEEYAEAMLSVWKRFSDAFAKLPFDSVNQVYHTPQNIGPVNLLYEALTGYSATMVRGFPYDDLKTWRSIYPSEVFEDVFAEISTEWGDALKDLQALPDTPALKEQKIIGEAVYCCLRSTYLQTRFIRLRDRETDGDILAVIREEEEMAKRLMVLSALDSRIGFEAANHYFYSRNELMEKVINCEYMLNKFSRQ